ncbi:MAG TPA: hypothetical protein VGG39_21540 [Polyangiaceae bacterium]
MTRFMTTLMGFPTGHERAIPGHRGHAVPPAQPTTRSNQLMAGLIQDGAP